jgi:hypothetical protein
VGRRGDTDQPVTAAARTLAQHISAAAGFLLARALSDNNALVAAVVVQKLKLMPLFRDARETRPKES